MLRSSTSLSQQTDVSVQTVPMRPFDIHAWFASSFVGPSTCEQPLRPIERRGATTFVPRPLAYMSGAASPAPSLG